MSHILPYQTARIQIHSDPDGSLHITIPPKGWAKILHTDSPIAFAIGLTCTLAGLAGPLIALGLLQRSKPETFPMFVAAVAIEPIVILVFAVALTYSAKRHTRIHVSSTDLLIEEFGFSEPTRHHFSRDEIASLDARIVTIEDQRFALRILRKRYDTPDTFLSRLPKEELLQITQLCQQTLHLPTS